MLAATVAAGQWRHDQVWGGSSARAARAAQDAIHPSYWLEGATIGAAVVGTTGALAFYELGCEFSEFSEDCSFGTVLGGALLGAAVGGTVGALIGGNIPAPRERPLRGQQRTAALVGAGAGALWSFGLFFQLCANGCRSEEVVLGLSTTAAGALAGLLVGR
jgi:hypothetical protein